MYRGSSAGVWRILVNLEYNCYVCGAPGFANCVARDGGQGSNPGQARIAAASSLAHFSAAVRCLQEGEASDIRLDGLE